MLESCNFLFRTFLTHDAAVIFSQKWLSAIQFQAGVCQVPHLLSISQGQGTDPRDNGQLDLHRGP